MNESGNYYEILGVPENSDFETIRKAYLRSKKSYGIESLSAYSLFNETELKEMLNNIEQAYMVLSDLSKRRAYDNAHGIKDKKILTRYEESERREEAPKQTSGSEHKIESQNEIAKTMDDKKAGAGELNITMKKSLGTDYQKDLEIEDWIKNCEEFNGEVFARVREYKKISIGELSEYTKISKRNIENIEREIFDQLPAPAYLRGFVIQLAKVLKLDWEKAAKSYMNRAKEKKL